MLGCNVMIRWLVLVVVWLSWVRVWLNWVWLLLLSSVFRCCVVLVMLVSSSGLFLDSWFSSVGCSVMWVLGMVCCSGVLVLVFFRLMKDRLVMFCRFSWV